MSLCRLCDDTDDAYAWEYCCKRCGAKVCGRHAAQVFESVWLCETCYDLQKPGVSYVSNVYYNPQEFGLSIVDVLDEPNLSYEFNTYLIVKHDATGRIFCTVSAGCSCPTPFESEHFNGPDDNSFSEIKAGDSFTSFEREVYNFPAPNDEILQVIIKVRELLRPVHVIVPDGRSQQLFHAFLGGDFEALNIMGDSLDEDGCDPAMGTLCRKLYSTGVTVAEATRKLQALTQELRVR